MRASIRSRSARGFTLLEVTVVMAIVSVLASIAIPTLSRMGLRTKQAERDVVMATILQNVRDFYVHFTTMPGGDGAYLAQPNPAAPTPAKQSWLRTRDATWQTFFRPGDEIQGGLYHSYWFTVAQRGDDIWLFIEADGDLDADGVPSRKWFTYHHPAGGAFEVQAVASGDTGPDIF